MKSKRGANQYGRFVWRSSDKSRTEAKYSAEVFCNGFSVEANCDSKDELVEDLKELNARVQHSTDKAQNEETGNEKLMPMLIRVVLLTGRGRRKVKVVQSKEFLSLTEARDWAKKQLQDHAGYRAHLFQCQAANMPSEYLLDIIH